MEYQKIKEIASVDFISWLTENFAILIVDREPDLMGGCISLEDALDMYNEECAKQEGTTND